MFRDRLCPASRRNIRFGSSAPSAGSPPADATHAAGQRSRDRQVRAESLPATPALRRGILEEKRPIRSCPHRAGRGGGPSNRVRRDRSPAASAPEGRSCAAWRRPFPRTADGLGRFAPPRASSRILPERETGSRRVRAPCPGSRKGIPGSGKTRKPPGFAALRIAVGIRLRSRLSHGSSMACELPLTRQDAWSYLPPSGTVCASGRGRHWMCLWKTGRCDWSVGFPDPNWCASESSSSPDRPPIRAPCPESTWPA